MVEVDRRLRMAGVGLAEDLAVRCHLDMVGTERLALVDPWEVSLQEEHRRGCRTYVVFQHLWDGLTCVEVGGRSRRRHRSSRHIFCGDGGLSDRHRTRASCQSTMGKKKSVVCERIGVKLAGDVQHGTRWCECWASLGKRRSAERLR